MNDEERNGLNSKKGKSNWQKKVRLTDKERKEFNSKKGKSD